MFIKLICNMKANMKVFPPLSNITLSQSPSHLKGTKLVLTEIFK